MDFCFGGRSEKAPLHYWDGNFKQKIQMSTNALLEKGVLLVKSVSTLLARFVVSRKGICALLATPSTMQLVFVMVSGTAFILETQTICE